MNRISSVVLFCIIFTMSVFPDETSPEYCGISVLTEARFNGELIKFFNQKSDDFLEKYIYEAKLGVDLSLLSYSSFHLLCRGELNAGLGESPFGLALHPFDINYAVNPIVEYRGSNMYASAGIDHRCFHYIDQKPPLPIVYWNRLAFSVYSPDRRATAQARMLLSESSRPEDVLSRFSWCGSWGYYISEFFGIVRPINLMSLTRPHYVHQFDGTVRYALLFWNNGRLELTERTMLGFKNPGKTFWMQEAGAEALFLQKGFNAALIARFTLDGGRFNSKDQLFECGLRIDR